MQKAAAQKVDSETKNFVKNARIGGLFEVESSRLALEKAQNAELKSFAQRMIDDHGKANQELEQIVSNQGIKVDEPPTKLDPKHQTQLDKLRAANGGQFDKLYLQMQQGAHNEAVTLFSKYVKGGDNAALKSFAQETLPTLEDHKKHVMGMHVS